MSDEILLERLLDDSYPGYLESEQQLIDIQNKIKDRIDRFEALKNEDRSHRIREAAASAPQDGDSGFTLPGIDLFAEYNSTAAADGGAALETGEDDAFFGSFSDAFSGNVHAGRNAPVHERATGNSFDEESDNAFADGHDNAFADGPDNDFADGLTLLPTSSLRRMVTRIRRLPSKLRGRCFRRRRLPRMKISPINSRFLTQPRSLPTKPLPR